MVMLNKNLLSIWFARQNKDVSPFNAYFWNGI